MITIITMEQWKKNIGKETLGDGQARLIFLDTWGKKDGNEKLEKL